MNPCIFCGEEVVMAPIENVGRQAFLWECKSCRVLAFKDDIGVYYDRTAFEGKDLIEVPEGCLFIGQETPV